MRGLAGFDAGSWNVVFLPKGTPEPIVRKLSAEIAKALPAPDVKAKLDSMGVLATGMDPKASAQFLGSEVEKWRGVIKTAGITLD